MTRCLLDVLYLHDATHLAQSRMMLSIRTFLHHVIKRYARPATIISVILLIPALLAADIAGLERRSSPSYDLDVGFWGDQELLDGVFEQETDPLGTTYRWTQERTRFTVRDFPVVSAPVLELRIGGLPPQASAPRPAQLAFEGTHLVLPVAATPRSYHVQLPTAALADGTLGMTLLSPTSRAPNDPRAVGIRLDDISIGWDQSVWAMPTWHIVVIQWLIVLLGLALALRLRMPRPHRIVLGGGLVGLQGWMAAYNPFMAGAWESRLLVMGIALLALIAALQPVVYRMWPGPTGRLASRALLLITVFAIAIRLFGLFYPSFGSHDLYIHRARLEDVLHGRLLLFDHPSEFGSKIAIVPPAFYVIAAPLTLIYHDPGVVLQGLYAFLDGTSALLVGLLVHRLGGGRRAALIAATCVAMLPIQFSILWWGFGPQIVGQWLLLLLAVLLCREQVLSSGSWKLATVVLSMAFLMHNGTVALGGLWLAVYLALSWRPTALHMMRWRRPLAMLVIAAAAAFVLLYSDVVLLEIRQFVSGLPTSATGDASARLRLIGKGLGAAFQPIGGIVAVGFLMALVRWTSGRSRWLVLGWLLSSLFFLIIDVSIGMQVRYAYFTIPMLCAGIGLGLERVMLRWSWGWMVGWGAVGLIAFTGMQLWLDGVILFVKPTLIALTH